MSKLGSFVGRVFRFCQLVAHMILASPFAQAGQLDPATDENPSEKSSGSGEASTAVPPEQVGALSGHSCTNACT